MARRAITALFDDYEEAAKAIDRVEAEGISHGDIAVVASNEAGRHDRWLPPQPTGTPQQNEVADGAGTGAAVGTLVGGGAGLLAGLGLIAIPGIGPVVAAGWLVAAVTGAGVGAAAGGLLGALTGVGLSHSEAETYAEGVRRGGTLVTVRADDDKADRVTDLLRRSGSIDLEQRSENWRSQGWTGGTSIDPSPAEPNEGGHGAGPAPEATEPRPATDPTSASPTRVPPGQIR